ncbi:hypothetical protein VH567_09535 [Sphingomonas sp. 4RDLI-65]|uniref:hypothetical protein n=1 Tax=Sphingomonas sp. 4RDLI-65 TaxID=3111641 RepID=UPI003C289339
MKCQVFTPRLRWSVSCVALGGSFGGDRPERARLAVGGGGNFRRACSRSRRFSISEAPLRPTRPNLVTVAPLLFVSIGATGFAIVTRS